MRQPSTSLIRAGSRAAPYYRALITPSRLTGSRLGFSHQAVMRSKQPNKSQPQPENPNPGNPELPKFSLEAMGLSRNMRLVVIGLISIFGTIETWFYCKAIWRWWKGGEGEKTPENSA